MRIPSFLVRVSLLLCLAAALACAKGDETAVLERSTGGESTESAPAVRSEEQRMDLESMDRILRAVGPQVERDGGVWSFEYLETPVLIITDSKANRMRVMSPVIDAEEVTPDQWAAILVANFHTALDARYAVSSGTVYSLFLHPLGSLTHAELRNPDVPVPALIEAPSARWSCFRKPSVRPTAAATSRSGAACLPTPSQPPNRHLHYDVA